jgi:FkbM family methyltransferase
MNGTGIRTLIKRAYACMPLKRPVLEVMRRTVRLPRRLTGHLSFRGTFTIEIDRLHRFKLEHWGYLVENDLFWNGFGKGYEATSLQVWRRLAPHAQVILDVGANTGIYTLVACCMNPNANVIAVEPVERVFQRLQRNVELNGYKVTLQQVAASDTNGSATMYDLSRDHEYTASLDRWMLQGGDGIVEYSVPTSRLDDVLSTAGVSTIDLVKIDVEQFEPQVLDGMKAFLSRCKPALLIEILNERVAREVNDITRDLGYSIFRIAEHDGLIRTSYIEATEFEERNYLLAQDEIVKIAGICDFVVS